VVKVCMKFERDPTITGWVIDNLATFCHRYVRLWPWPLTLILNVCSRLDVTWSNSIPNFSELPLS